LRTLLPFLREKKGQAEVALRILALQKGRNGVNHTREIRAEIQLLATELKVLKRA